LSITQLIHWKELRQNCACAECHATVLRHSLLGRRAGIRLGQDWFCSPECFGEGLELCIRHLHDFHREGKQRRTARIPLGLLLLTRGLITQPQLEAATAHQQTHGGTVGEALCELQFATERQVAEAAAMQWGCALFQGRPQIEGSCPRIPATLMKLAGMAPMHFAPVTSRLLVGFVHGVEHGVLRTIEEMTGCTTEPCFITASDCSTSIRSLAGRHVEVSFGASSTTAEIASIVQSYATQIGAGEARVARCLDLLWVRLMRDGHPTDLLFALSDAVRRHTSFDNYCDVN
jgi:hypothetical protein